MKVVFTAWLFINGAWTHGSAVNGWFPINMGEEVVCEQALEYANEHSVTQEHKFTCESVQDTITYINDLMR